MTATQVEEGEVKSRKHQVFWEVAKTLFRLVLVKEFM